MYASHIIAGIAITLLLVTLMPMAFANHCGVDEFHTPTNTCEDDNESPELLVDGTAGDRTINILVGSTYTHLPHTVTDNDPNYNSPFATITVTPSAVDTSRPGTFTVEYMAEGDIAGNGDNLIILVTVIVSCPTGQAFIGTACIIPEFGHVLTFGSAGDANGQFRTPQGIAVSSMHIIVVELDGHRVQIFDTSGNHVNTFGSDGSSDGQFRFPSGIATNNTHIFVADTFNRRIQIFDINGTYAGQFGSMGSGAGQFNNPRDITANSTHLFVSDSLNHRVQIFDIDGNHVKTFGSSGDGNGKFNQPRGSAANSTHIFIVDLFNHRIQIFDNAGNYAGQFGSEGSGNGQFNIPQGIATNSTHLFVADNRNDRVQIFDINGNYLAKFEGSGSTNGEFDGPTAIATNSTHLFVVDSGNSRIQIFQIANLMSCADDEIRTISGCATIIPVITVGGSSANRTITVVTGISYTVPAGVVTDNDGDHTGIVTANPSTINTTSPGSFTIRYTALADAAGNIPVPVVLTVNVIDTPPVITVGGSSENRTITVVTGTSYTVPAGVVTDNDDNYNETVTANPSTIVTTSPGTFTIRYTAPADVSGNIPVPVVFTVNVIDTTPVITVGGSSENQTISVEVGTSYTVPAGVVTDNDDNYNETVTANPSTIVTTSPGTFTIRYTAPADVSGNIPVPVVLTVNVTDTIPPVITVAGSNNNRTISISLNQYYLLPNSTITDVDTAYTGSVTVTVNGEPFDVSTPLDTSSAGTFTVRYTANADASGNAPNPVVLTIHVTQCTPPEIFDGDSCVLPQFNHVLSFSGTGANSFNFPIGVTTTSTNILIVDTLNRRVQVYDSNGNYQSQFGSNGAANGQFNNPVGITTNGTHLYIADNANHRVQIFDDSGNHVKTFGTQGSGDGEFSHPQNILTNNTHLFVTDANNHRVQIFDMNGNYAGQFGESGNGPGQFNTPNGITTDGTSLFVTDSRNYRVQIWDFNGNYIKSFGIQGNGPGGFNSPQPIIATHGNLYVADTNNRRIQVYDFSGNFITQFGVSGSADGQFSQPRGIATNNTHIFVADSANNRIQIFEIPSSLVSEACTGDQIRDTFGFCIIDIEAPIIANEPISLLQNSVYRPSPVATDNDQSFNGLVRSSSTADTLDTSSIGSFTITYTVTDPSGNTGSAIQTFTIIAQCPATQIPDSAGVFCIPDTIAPVITVDGSSSDRSFKIADNQYYLLPTPFVTDNDPAYSGTVTVTLDGNPFDVTTPLNHAEGSYTIRYMASADAAGNVPTTVEYRIDPQNCGGSNVAALTGCVTAQVGFGNSFGSSGGGNGQLARPVGATTNDTHLFVADSENGRIQIFDLDGNYAGKFGGGGGGFSSPWGITNNGTHVFVTDRSNHRVQILDINGNFIKTFGSEGIGNGEFVNPEGISTNGTHLYVVDHGRNRIQIWDTNGNFIKVSGTGGGTATAGVFDQPNGITTNGSHLFVADTHNFRIQIWDNNGTYIKQFGTAGREHGRLHHPEGIAASHAYLFIADSDTDRFQVYDFNGRFIAQQDGGFNEPRGIAVTDTRIYVTDYFNNRVLIYTLSASLQPADCTVGQVRNFTNSCIVDTEAPVIVTEPILVLQNSTYRPSPVVTDNDPNFDGILRSSSNIDPFDTSSLGSFTIPLTATDPAGNIDTANQMITIVAQCPGNLKPDAAGIICLPDTIPPVIVVDGRSDSYSITTPADRGFYFLPIPTVTDNDPDYDSPVTVTLNTVRYDITTPLDTSSAGEAIIQYTAPPDANNNVPTPITLTLNIFRCPSGQQYYQGTCYSPSLSTLSTFGGTGGGNGQFARPVGITTNDTHLFVADSENNRIQIFDTNGNYAGKFGGGASGFSSVFGVAHNGTHIFATDRSNHRVQIFDASGNFIKTFGSQGQTPGQFQSPNGIATNGTHLYVVDTGRNRVQIFDTNGNFVKQFGGGGNSATAGKFNVPEGIATNGKQIFVADKNNFRVQVWDINGNYQSQFGIAGRHATELQNPYGLAVSYTHIFVGDSDTDRLQVYDFNGNLVSEYHSGFDQPRGIATNNTHLFVADYFNNRVQIIALSAYFFPIPCAPDQILDILSGDCPVDVKSPVITTLPPLSVQPIHVLQNSIFRPTYAATDNHPNFDGIVRTSHTIDPLDTSSVGTITITYTATDPAGNIGTASQEFIITAQCPANQIPDPTGAFCITDIIPPVIVIDGGSNNRTVPVTIGQFYMIPAPTISDNDPNYASPVTVTINGEPFDVTTPFDTSSAGTFIVQYMAQPDANNNAPNPLVLTLILETCPPNQEFTGSACVIPQFEPVLSLGGNGINIGELSSPIGIATTRTNIFIVDTFNNRVQVFDINGNYISQFGSQGSADGQFDIPIGITTDNTHLYVVDFRNDRVQIFDHSGTHVKSFGSQGTGIGEFNRPHHVTTTGTHLYITDTDNNRVQIFDLMGNYAGQFGGAGGGDGEFNVPRGITTNGTHLFVVDTENDRVQIFFVTGNYVSQFGESGNGTGQFQSPRAITSTNTHLYVTDAENDRVQVYDFNGNFVSQFGENGNGTGQFDEPRGIATNNTHIFVTDSRNHRIQIFETSHVLLSESCLDGQIRDRATICYTPVPLVSSGFSTSYVVGDAISGSFTLPADITDEIYSITGLSNIAINTDGMVSGIISCGDIGIQNLTTIATFAVGLRESTHQQTITVTDTTPSSCMALENVLTFGVVGRGDGTFLSPNGITTNYTHIFVADGGNNRIQIFDNNGTYAGKFGSIGSTDGKLSFPVGITTNFTHLFIVDQNNHRIQIFDVMGNYVSQFGDSGFVDGRFNQPQGIATNFTHLFVTDATGRIQIWDIDGTFVKSFGGLGSTNGLFNQPRGIATNGTHLYISDQNNNRVQIFDNMGNYVSQFGDFGNGTGQFNQTSGIATNNTHLFVVDTDNHRIQIFDNMGNYVNQFGSRGTGAGEFSFPQAIATNSTHLYVADTDNNRVQVFAFASIIPCTSDQIRLTTGCIVDTTAPVISIDESRTISVTVGQSYILPAVTIYDNDPDYASPVTVTVNGTAFDVTTPFDTSSAGTFTIQYMAQPDASNNVPTPLVLTLNLIACPADQIYNGTACVAHVATHVLSFGETGDNSFNLPAGITTNDTHIFIVDTRNNRIQIFDNTGTYAGQFGTLGLGNGDLNRPEGITTNGTHLYISDTSNHRIEIFDFNGNYADQFGSGGPGNGQFNRPEGITTNGTHFYIVDTDNHRVQVFDNMGNYTDQFGGLGSTNGLFNQPRGIATNHTHLFVADTNNHRVQVFDNMGNYVSQFGGFGNGTSQFKNPEGITTTFTHLYISDTNNNRVQIFDLMGNYTGQFGSLGDGDEEFNTPRGITTNYTHILVTDSGNNRAQIFEIPPRLVPESCLDIPVNDRTSCVPDATLPVITVSDDQRTFLVGATYAEPSATISDNDPAYNGTVTTTTSPSAVDTASPGSFTIRYMAPADASGNLPLPVTITITVSCPVDHSFNGTACTPFVANHVLTFGSRGPDPGQFNFPRDIAINNTHLFIPYTSTNIIQIFDINGDYISQFGGPGTGNGQLGNPRGIITNNTHIFIVDVNNERVQIFDINGNYVSQFGGSGTGNGQFRTPDGIATNGTHLYVVDRSIARVQIFDINGNFIKSFGSSGNGTGKFSGPTGITTDNIHIFISDTFNHRVQIWDINGNYVSEFGGEGNGNGKLSSPYGITTTLTHLFVADSGNHRIQIFDINGNYVDHIRGTNPFASPLGVAINNTHLFVTDTNNHRIQIYALSSDLISSISCPDEHIRDIAGTCVRDDIPPLITVNGSSNNRNVTTITGTSYPVLAGVVTDNDQDYSETVTHTPTSINTAIPGVFTIIYEAPADASGNEPVPVVFTVNVVPPPDTTRPVITVNGNSTNRTVTVTPGEPYTVPAGAVTDNVPGYSGTITATPSTIDTNRAGYFNVTYTADPDASGNVPLPVVLTVIVPCPDDQVFDGTECTLLQFRHTLSFGVSGDGDGQFNRPRGITTNDTHIFIVDLLNHRIQIFDNMGNYTGQFGSGSSGSGNGEFNVPIGITTNSTHLFVTESGNRRVQIFDVMGNYTGQFSGGSSGQFAEPLGITANRTHLFVTDNGNNRISIFDINGNHVKSFGSQGDAIDQFGTPFGITTNRTHLFVVDTELNRVQIFDTNGNSVKAFGGPSAGTGNGQFDSPIGITTNRTHIFVADTDNHRIQIFDINGNYADQFGSQGNGTGEFNSPSGIATNRTHLFISDGGNNRIQIYQFASLLSCPDGQVSNDTDCITDITAPVIAVDGSSENRTVTITEGESYAIPTGIVTDNDVSYFEIVTFTSTVDTSSVGNYTITYSADPDASGNPPVPVIITVTVTCPAGQLFDGNACVQILEHVLSFGSQGMDNGKFRFPLGITANNTHLFVADSSNDRIQIWDINGNYVTSFGGTGTTDGLFSQPNGITTNDTHLYIADTFNDRVQIWDINGSYVKSFGSQGIDNGEFNRPQGIATNNTHLFVTDENNNRVQIWDINGNYISQFGSQGNDTGEFNSPIGIATNNTHIFVADTGNNRVQIWDINGNYTGQFGVQGNGTGEFNALTGIAVTTAHIYIADTDNHRVQIFDINGNYADEFGSEGSSDGEFNSPQGIATNSTHLYVSDTANNRVQIFTLSSDLISCLVGQIIDRTDSCIVDTAPPTITVSSDDALTFLVGATYNEPSANVTDNDPAYSGIISTTPSSINTTSPGTFNVTYTAPADAAGNTPIPVVITVNVSCSDDQFFNGTACMPILEHVLSFGSGPGAGIGQFNRPAGITTNNTHIFIAEFHSHRVQIWDINGNYVSKFGIGGNGTGQFDRPNEITTNNTHIFVADNGNDRVQIFDINGNYISQFGSGSLGSVNGEFNKPQGITTNGTHHFISDTSNQRIQILDINGNFVSKFGSFGTENSQFIQPRAITTNGTHLYIADSGNDRIQIFDVMGNYISQFGSEGSGNGEFDTPVGITTNNTHLFVSDTNNHRIQIFDNNGNYVGQFGSQGSANGQFDLPSGITTNSTHLFVADFNNHRIQVFEFASIVACSSDEIRITTGCIIDNAAPIITITGPGSVTILQNSTYTVLPPTIYDIDPNYDGSFTASSTTSPLDTSTIETVTITYMATDPSNNTGTATQSIDIVAQCPAGQILDSTGVICLDDTDPPVIMVVPTTLTFRVGETFTPPTVNLTDNDPAYSGTISNTTSPSPIDTSSVGTFTITYNATADAAGNAPVLVNVTVTVTACATNQIIDPVTSTCVDDTERPVIMVTYTEITLQVGDTFTPPTVNLTDNNPAYSGTISNTTSPSPIDTSSAGTFTITYNATADAAGNAPILVTVTVNVTDTTAPTIRVDPTTITLQIGQTFTPPTVNLTDNDPAYSGTISNTTSPSPIDTSSVGTFTITYNATADAAGNAPVLVNVTVTVTPCSTGQVIDPVTSTCMVDTESPVIEVTSTIILLQVGDTFTPPTVNLTDNDPAYSGTISNTTSPSPIDTSSAGTFTITYNATADAAGNAPILVTVTVNVTDTTAPTIRVDPTTITLQIGQTFTPPTVNLTDNDPAYSGTISNTTSPSPIDTSSVGTFTITYNATADAAGNAPVPVEVTVTVTACATNQIIDPVTSTCVDDTERPVIMVTYTEITLQVGDTFTPPTVNLTDNNPAYSGTISNTTSPSPIDTSSTGTFTITYNATADAAENVPILVTVTVTVIDTTAPTIRVDPTSITLQIGDTYTPPTVIISDNDPDYSETVTITPTPGPVDTSMPGNYTITYTANPDASGNAPATVEVTVIVTPCDADQILDSVTNTCVTDTMPPRITVDPITITLELGNTYTPPTVTIEDNDPAYVGSVTVDPSTIDTTSTGIFTIMYSAPADAGGNIPDNVTATVEIVDTTAPTIRAIPASIALQIGQTFTPPTVTVMDNDPDYVETITNSTLPSDVDTRSAGTFTITYMASADAAGNEPTPVTVTVTVTACAAGQVIGAATSTCIVDTTPPRITASYTSIELEIDDPFTPPIVTLSDNDQAYSGTLTNSTSPSAVDTSSIGVFTITYEAPADASNNGPVTVTVTVEIVDNDAPTITVTSTTITLQMGQPFTLPSATISDNDRAYSGTVTATPSTINTASPGTFTIQYTGTADASGNVPTPVTVTVIVTPCETDEIIDPVTNTCIVDDEPPVITVSSNHIILLIDTTYIEPIVTVSDNNPSYFESITSAPTPGPVDTSSAGNYTITYSAPADAAGNAPIPVEVIIEVVAQCPRDTVEDHFRTCIIDTSPPIIIVPGSLSVTVLVGANYTLPNATVSDNTISYNETVTFVGTVDTSVIGLYTITYMADADASGNTPATVTLTVTVATECPTGQMPNDDDVCFVPRTSGGSSSDWKTKPTFGLSWENNQPFISNGFTLNDYTLDITNNWHTSFVPVNGVIGKENNAKIKVYAPKGLSTVMLSLGVPEVGKINDAETNIIVSILPNYTGTISYIIAEITHEQKESLVDETQTTATLSKSLCNDSDTIQKCYTVDINFVVLAPLKSDPVAITAIDTKHRYTTTYINEGLTFTGNSMLEPATAQLVVKKGNQYDAETIDLIQQDRRHNLWEDQYGNLWTQNDHETWIQLTFPENTSTDSYVNVMTRMHSAFDSRIDVHTQNMESIRDSMYKDVYTDDDQ